MNTIDLQLKCGNPEIKDTPASFSRFVFPFAYRLQKLETQAQGLCYQSKPNNDTSCQRRKKYLTNETALVLFERAKWFEIADEDWKKTPWEKETITVTLKTGYFEIKMLPPTLVLFEFTEPQKKTRKQRIANGLFICGYIFSRNRQNTDIG